MPRASKFDGAFIPGATGEGQVSESFAWHAVLQFLSAGDIANARAIAEKMLGQVERGEHRNPPLVIYGNPPFARHEIRLSTVLGFGEQIKYRRTATPRGFYFHDFGKNDAIWASELYTISGETRRVILILNQHGKPLWGTGE